MDIERFEELVHQAVERLPDEIRELIDNVDIVVADRPTPEQLKNAGQGQTLFGLYEGVPQTERGRHYGLVLPDKITIFQSSFEWDFSGEGKIAREIEKTIKHEIAHHFGISDERLKELEQ